MQGIVIPKENRVSLHSPLYGTHNLIFHSENMGFATVELIEYMLWLSPRAETLSISRDDYPNRVITNAVLKVHFDSFIFHPEVSSV